MRLLSPSLGMIFCLSLCVSVAHGDDLRGFWQKDAARDWDSKPKDNSSDSMDFKEVPAGAQKSETQPELTSAALVERTDGKAPATEEEIIKRFGNPKEKAQFVPDKNAPIQLQGMMAAMNSGNKKLAFEYAQAYSQYLKSMKELVFKGTQYTLLAMESEGTRPEIDEKDPDAAITPERLELREELAKAKIARTKEEALRELSPEARKLLENEQDFAEMDDQVSRTTQAVQNEPLNIPVDAQGKVQVLFFFSMSDAESLKTARMLQGVMAKFQSDPGIKFFGLVDEGMSAIQLALFSNQQGINLPLINGAQLKERLKISKTPTLMFAAETSGKTYSPKGVSTADEVEKIVRLMQGGRS